MLSRFRILVSFALRDVSKSRIVLILTIVSLSTAFTAIFLSNGILEGFTGTLERGSINDAGYLHIKPADEKAHIGNIDGVMDSLKTMENVQRYSLRSFGQIALKNGDKVLQPYMSVGIIPSQESLVSKTPSHLVAGRYLTDTDTKSVVLGTALADALHGLVYDGRMIGVGSKIDAFGLSGNQGQYTVVGIVDGKNFIPNWMAFFPKKELERLDNSMQDSEIIVDLKDPALMETTRRAIGRAIPGVDVVTWKEDAGYITDIMQGVSLITSSISLLLILTVFIIMSVIIFINVLQHRRQIGILKSMGASSRFIVSIYLLESLVYSILSLALGLSIFLLMDVISNSHPVPMLIGDFYTKVVTGNIIIAFVIMNVAAIGGSILPATLAARTEIADVLMGM